jgi:hypothetical protein
MDSGLAIKRKGMKKFKSLKSFHDLWSAKNFKGLGAQNVINVKACLLLSAGVGFTLGFLIAAALFTPPHPVEVPPAWDFPGTGGLESEKTKPAR